MKTKYLLSHRTSSSIVGLFNCRLNLSADGQLLCNFFEINRDEYLQIDGETISSLRLLSNIPSGSMVSFTYVFLCF